MTDTTRKYTYEAPTITYNTRLVQPATPSPKQKGTNRHSQPDARRQRDIVIKLIQFIKSL